MTEEANYNAKQCKYEKLSWSEQKYHNIFFSVHKPKYLCASE
jgi:hypothetical protein